MSNKIQTKYGTATLQKNGYYYITSRKEGNYKKLLHRLIYEDYWKVTLLPIANIHHINEDKTDNRIENLEIIHRDNHIGLHSKRLWENKEYRKRKLDSMTKNYARITKRGSRRGQQLYTIVFNSKRIRSSTYPNNLVEWFIKEYPNQILVLSQILNS